MYLFNQNEFVFNEIYSKYKEKWGLGKCSIKRSPSEMKLSTVNHTCHMQSDLHLIG